MIRKLLLIWLAISSIGAFTAQASEPKVVLVLSGGGARGVAHIGVIKALEQLHIPIHGIVGNSPGVAQSRCTFISVNRSEQSFRISNCLSPRACEPYNGWQFLDKK